MRIRVVVADDFPLMQRGLAAALEPDPGIEVVGLADDGQDALRLARELAPDVMLLDLHMPELGGLAVLERMREEVPLVRTIVVTASHKAENLLDAVAAGAAGYLTKRSSAEQLRQAVITVHGGGSVITPELAGHLLKAYAHHATDRDEPNLRPALSRREQEILRLVAQGHTDREAGAELNLSTRTVQNNLTRIREKTGMRRRAELARWAAEHTYL